MNSPTFEPLGTKDLLSVSELSAAELEQLFRTAATLKQDYTLFQTALAGRTLVMLFEKPSLRTRVSFEVGICKLGGDAVYLDHQAARIGERESLADCAKNLERWTDAIVARTFSHESVTTLATHAGVPVINALSDLYHPCQALADLLTLAERFPATDPDQLGLAWVGDGNNVCHSLMLITATLGMKMTVITPPGRAPDPEVVDEARVIAATSGATLDVTDQMTAVAGHHAVYTDTWVSMGAEAEAAAIKQLLQPYQVTADVMAAAGPDACFMHCLPAYRGHEVTAEVIDSPRSVVFDQAENRMHVQNAVLLHTVGAAQAVTA